MKVVDYLLMRTPERRLGDEKTRSREAKPGKVSPRRIVFSLLGLILGIIASFLVTGIEPSVTSDPTAIQKTDNTENVTHSNDTQNKNSSEKKLQPKVKLNISWDEFLMIGIFSLVICGLTYQQLFFSIKLYNNEPAFLILFVSFQYGYFWQSVIKGGSTILTGT